MISIDQLHSKIYSNIDITRTLNKVTVHKLVDDIVNKHPKRACVTQHGQQSFHYQHVSMQC